MLTETEELKISGRLVLVPGREFTANGIRGRLRFVRGVVPAEGEPWADGHDKDGRYRSVRVSRIRKVHAKAKTSPPDQIKPKPPKGKDPLKTPRRRRR